MLSRRGFLACTAAAALAKPGAMSHKERIDRALKGLDVDRPPFSYWHHFGLEKEPPERHAQATIAFHRQFHTDLVKVMSDFPYPKPEGEWFTPKVHENPFPAQIRALEIIQDGLGKDALFVETVFNPWTVAEKLSSAGDLMRLKQERPQVLLDCLDAIARSEANHAKRAIAAGASGIFIAIANAQPEVLNESEYVKFSEPFDRMILDGVNTAPLNVLHLHGDHVYLGHFTKNWPASGINYSVHATGVPLAGFRKGYSGVLLAGLDEKNYRTLTEHDLRAQWQREQKGAGKKFILTPGCSVPNESTDAELMRLPKILNA